MLFFDYRAFFKQIFHSSFPRRDSALRLTPGRIRFLAVFAVLFPFSQIFTWICLALDHLFYPKFRRVSLKDRTLFIVGNFRSGSTFLHQQLAEDSINFTSLSSWEIYAAPSLLQRKFYRGLKIVDGVLGALILSRLQLWDRLVLQKVPFHSVSVWNPEEDAGLLLYCWYSLFSLFFFPDWKAAGHLIDFRDVSGPRRRRIIRFYSACLKRHLFTQAPGAIFVSKNPSFTPLIADLAQIPGSRFITLIRHPIETYVSTLRWLSFAWHVFADPVELHPFREEVAEMVHLWYERIHGSELESTRLMHVRFEQLTKYPVPTLESIYELLGRNLSIERAAAIEEGSSAVASGGRSGPDEVGLNPSWLAVIFHDIIKAYGFPDVGEPDVQTRRENDAGIPSIRTMDKA